MDKNNYQYFMPIKHYFPRKLPYHARAYFSFYLVTRDGQEDFGTTSSDFLGRLLPSSKPAAKN